MMSEHRWIATGIASVSILLCIEVTVIMWMWPLGK